MDEVEPNVKHEKDDRLVCRVCDNRKSCLDPNYLCSKNCEKRLLLIQGLMLGNVLQSLFGAFCQFGAYGSENGQCGEKAGTLNHQWSNKLHLNSVSCYETSESDGCREVTERVTLLPEPRVMLFASPLRNSLASDPDTTSNGSDPAESVLSKHDLTKSRLRSKSKRQVQPVTRLRSKANFRVKPKTRSKKKSEHYNTGKVSGNTYIQTSSRQKGNKRSAIKFDTDNHRKTSASPVSDKDSTVLPFEESNDQAFSGVESENCAADTDNTSTSSDRLEKRRVKCRRCGKMISKSYLYVHYRAMHKDHLSDISDSSVSCSECGKMFMKKQALNAHKLKRHNHKFTNTCNHCGKGFASRFGLSWHMRQVHKVTVRQCGDCGETFENRREYKKHRRYKHTANSHVCHICGKGFKLNNALQAHLDAHAGIKLHFCEKCGDGFVRFSSLCQHRNNLHGPKKSELPFKCHLCPNTFRLQAWLDKHIVQKHKSVEKTVKEDCELCKHSLRTSVNCPLHAGQVRDAFSCPQCDKVFAKDTNLKVHMKQHQEPKFSCDICHKKFTYKCNMLRHRDTHSTEKPFHCSICAKKFCTKFLLASHMRMHNQDLMFKCEICGKGLTRKDYLKNHLKKMHPEHAQATS